LAEVALDPALWRWTPRAVTTLADAVQYVKDARSSPRTMLPFAIVLLDGARVVGSTRYGNAAPEHRRVEVGWSWVARPWQRTAVNTEAKYLLLRHAFDALGCARVEFKTDALNAPSRRALLRMGAREEGTLRSHMNTADGRLRDSVYYSIRAADWPALGRALEARLRAG
jgi:RimJ/RimL family protein N-acetyltransferase